MLCLPCNVVLLRLVVLQIVQPHRHLEIIWRRLVLIAVHCPPAVAPPVLGHVCTQRNVGIAHDDLPRPGDQRRIVQPSVVHQMSREEARQAAQWVHADVERNFCARETCTTGDRRPGIQTISVAPQQGHTCEAGEGGKNVHRMHQSGPLRPSCRWRQRAAAHKGHGSHAALEDRGLAATQRPVAAGRGRPDVGPLGHAAVLGGRKDQGVVPHAVVLEHGHQPPHTVVQTAGHGAKHRAVR
mmetsp:Transcript_45345/g.82013  ORF Transcript_45345/g.82013 Transcript_45345/m.82013 type:complete len:240 (-) Transcript_45345:27-746(-)